MANYNERLLDRKIEKNSNQQVELTPEKAAQCISLNVLIAGSSSYTRTDKVNVISLGHLFI